MFGLSVINSLIIGVICLLLVFGFTYVYNTMQIIHRATVDVFVLSMFNFFETNSN